MSKFVNGLITGGVAAAAGEVLDKAETCLDKAEQKMF